MAEFLHTLLVLTALGSVLTGLLLLSRPLIRSKTVFYYLWLLVLIRLCLPVGVTIPLPARAPEAPAQAVVQQQPAARPVQPEQVQRPDGQGETAEPQTRPETQTDLPAASWRGVLTSPVLWFALWGVGAAFCLGRQVVGYRRFARLVRESGTYPEPGALALLSTLDPSGRVGLTVCPYVSTPMLLGVIRPTIVLPCEVEGDRLGDILAHELTHARRQDLLYKWFAVAVTSFHWFNPLMVVVRRQLNRACELSCDETVVKRLDAAGRRHYGETLLAMAAGQSTRSLLAVTLSEEKKHLKERLVGVMKYQKQGPAALALTLALAVALAGCAAIWGAQPAPSAGEEPDPAALLDDPVLYDLSNGLTAALPADLDGQLLVDTPESGEIFFSVFERRSYEAGGGGGTEGMGWLFSIARYDQPAFELSLAEDNSGRSFFARKDGWYYACLTPTDVRFYSESEPEEQAREEIQWRALLLRLPEGILPDFMARNGLEPFTSSDYANDDGSLWDGKHYYIRYHTPDWSESITMLLSQPARQGTGGIWCVEGYFNNHIGGAITTIPRDTGMTISDYYAQLQSQADRGERGELLTPEGAALDWLASRYDGVTADQLTRLEGEPAWDLWSRELSPILSEALTVGTLVYVDGAYTQVENVTGEPPYQPTLYTRLWVKAEDPGPLNGPAVRYDAGEKGAVIFLEQDGLVRVEHDGEISWYREAYDYENTSYEVMAELLQAWKEAEAAEKAPAADVYGALERVFDYDYDVEFYGFKEPGSGPGTVFVSQAELPQLREWLADCTWEEVAELPQEDFDSTDPPAGCYSLWLVGKGSFTMGWGAPYVSSRNQYWYCTQGYEQLYQRMAGLWAEKQAAGFPSNFRGWITQGGGQPLLWMGEEKRGFSDWEEVLDLMDAMTWTPADPGQGQGITASPEDRYVTVTVYPGNLVYYDLEGHGGPWSFWYQGSGETDLYDVLLDRWERAEAA